MKQIGMKLQKRFIPVIIVIAAIFAVVLGSVFYLNDRPDYIGKAESITIGYAPFEQTALLWIETRSRLF